MSPVVSQCNHRLANGRLCGQLYTPTKAGVTRCAQHQAEYEQQRYQRKQQQNAARRKRDGRDQAAWPRIRKVVLARDGHICDQCGGKASQVHKRGGGFHDLSALDEMVSLCSSCHGRIHGREAAALQRRHHPDR
jgi:hypothetical protein